MKSFTEMWNRRKREYGMVREEGWVEGEGWSGRGGRLFMPGSMQYFSLCLLLVTDPTSSGLEGAVLTWAESVMA